MTCRLYDEVICFFTSLFVCLLWRESKQDWVTWRLYDWPRIDLSEIIGIRSIFMS